MRGLLVQILCISLSDLLLCAADSSTPSADTLKKLSAAGEQYVAVEIKRALLGVKQMKEMMEDKEEKHKHLLDALRCSRDKKEGAMQLASETKQKLEEAKQQCRDQTKASSEQCRPCLEDACKAFYTATCRRGLASFSFKVEGFFRKTSSQFTAAELVNTQPKENMDHTNALQSWLSDGEADAEVLEAEASFSQLLFNISLLYNQSITLAKKMQQVFGQPLLAALTTELHPSPLSDVQGGSKAEHFRTLGHIVDSAYDFGRNVLEEFSSTVAEAEDDHFQPSSRGMGSFSAPGLQQDRHMCRRLRRQASECLQLQDVCETCKDYLLRECPRVQQLHSEMEEMYMLLNASSQQHHDRLQLLQRHAADARRWLSSMSDKHGWVGQLPTSTGHPLRIFSVVAVIPQHQAKDVTSKPDSSVVVTILNSAPLTVLVPTDLEVDDPAFIQYAAQEALAVRKRTMRGTV